MGRMHFITLYVAKCFEADVAEPASKQSLPGRAACYCTVASPFASESTTKESYDDQCIPCPANPSRCYEFEEL